MSGSDAPAPLLPPEIRGMFGPHGDSVHWLNATASNKFPNGVPRFTTKDEALAFMKDYIANHGGSNPEHPHLQHIFTMLIGWEQIESILLPNIQKARQEPSLAKKVPRSYGVVINGGSDGGGDDNDNDTSAAATNVFDQAPARPVVRAIAERLDVPFHRCTTPASVMNTLRYLFFHMKCGIYVMIRNGQLRIFAPFVNIDFRNTWSEHLRLEGDGTLDSYYTQKAGLYREEQVQNKNRTTKLLACARSFDSAKKNTQTYISFFSFPSF
jgi:hypothetical protein